MQNLNSKYRSSLLLLFDDLKKKNLIKNNVDLAKKLNVSPSLITEWTKGRAKISIEKLIEISTLFNVKICVVNGNISYDFLDETESISPSIQNSINYLKNLANSNHKDLEKFLDSLQNLIKKKT